MNQLTHRFWGLVTLMLVLWGCMKAEQSPPQTAATAALHEEEALVEGEEEAKMVLPPADFASPTPEAPAPGFAQPRQQVAEKTATADSGMVMPEEAAQAEGGNNGPVGHAIETKPMAQAAAGGKLQGLGDYAGRLNKGDMRVADPSSTVAPVISGNELIDAPKKPAEIALEGGYRDANQQRLANLVDSEDKIKRGPPDRDKGEAKEDEEPEPIEEEKSERSDENDEQVGWDGKDDQAKDGYLSGEKNKKKMRRGQGDDSRMTTTLEDVTVEQRPSSFLPRMFYFENTYLGGNAASMERLRRLWGNTPELAMAVDSLMAYPQRFDVPNDAGLALVADLDRTSFEGPGRVYLQVGLRGSDRYGWRRPPLDLALVLALGPQSAETAIAAVQALMTRLGPQDRLSIVEISETPVLVSELERIKKVRSRLSWGWKPTGSAPTADTLVRGLDMAAESLRQGAAAESAVVGTRTLLVVTEPVDPAVALAAAAKAHSLTVEGFVSSVIEVNPNNAGELWQIADAGHGGYHRADANGLVAAVDAELSMLSQVVARLLRLNIRLSKSAHCIRVLGAQVLTAQQVTEVKAREVATDQQLSKTMGIKADRGDDDDGAQTVIPYFLGGDSHVVVLELWVDEPGPVADITVKYKDMVNLRNGTATTSVALRTHRRPETPRDQIVRENLAGFRLAEQLSGIAAQLNAGHQSAWTGIGALRQSSAITTKDRQALTRFEALANSVPQDAAVDALRLGAARKVGQSYR